MLEPNFKKADGLGINEKVEPRIIVIFVVEQIDI